MIKKIFLSRMIVFLLVISAVFALLSLSSIRFQFSLWELFIDAKIITAAAVVVVAWKKEWIDGTPEFRSLFRFEWRPITAIFFAPLAIYLFPIAIGYGAKELSLNPLDNAATLVLGTLFDIPALFVFSATSIFIEEVIFRGVLFRSLRTHRTLPFALVLTNLVWMIFCLSETLSIPDISILKAGIIGLFFFSIGVFCSALTVANTTVWMGYSFRVGILALTPIVLTSFLAESDSFFTTESLLFAADGLIVSLVLLAASAYILRRHPDVDQNTGK